MAVDMKNLGSIQAYQKSAKMDFFAEKQDTLKNRPDLPEQASGVAQAAVDKTFHSAKLQMQASVVTHLFNQGSEKEIELFSMKMTYQSAIEAINEKLRADLGLDANATAPVSQEKLNEQGGMEYWSPENTAKRIVEGAKAFLGGFQSAHPELSGEALMDRFMEVVGGGLIQGFEEAKGLLGDLKVFEGTVAENYQSTYDLVQQGMEDFRQSFLNPVEEGVTESVDNTTSSETVTGEVSSEENANNPSSPQEQQDDNTDILKS